MREVILSSLPPPNGHYSHAVVFNGTAYVSGVLPMRVKPGASVKEQFDAVFDIIEAILKECESSLDKVVNCRIYIARNQSSLQRAIQICSTGSSRCSCQRAAFRLPT